MTRRPGRPSHPLPRGGDTGPGTARAAARMRADTWDASIQTLPEWQCRPHSADYIWRGPSTLRVWKEVDPVTREIVAWHAEWLRSVDRPIYMDGRARPTDVDPSFHGYSIGHWEGEKLVVETTNYNQRFWISREGPPTTEFLKMTDAVLSRAARAK